MAGKADIVDHVASNVEGITKKQAGDARALMEAATA